MKKLLTPTAFFIAGSILTVAFMRLLPMPYNFAPVGAMALFAGARLKNKYLAFLVPLTAMLLSDIALEIRNGYGFHDTMWAVYGCFLLTVFLGMSIRNKKGFMPVVSTSLASSMIFFLVTNFAVWLNGSYGLTISGLITCYEAAVPFYRNELFPLSSPMMNTILGDLFYNGILFGSLALAKSRIPALSRA